MNSPNGLNLLKYFGNSLDLPLSGAGSEGLLAQPAFVYRQAEHFYVENTLMDATAI